MDYFHYRNNTLYIEQIALHDIAHEFGTPCYVYSQTMLENNWQQFDDAFAALPHQICYAVKANSNLAILALFAQKNSGFDIVSQGELERVIKAGGDPAKIVFSGVGKKPAEIIRALQLGIQCFNVESENELFKINEIAQSLGVIAPVALRVNPNIDAKTHPYIATGMNENKFGIAYENILPLLEKIKTLTHVKLTGIGCHIGSQLTSLAPFLDAADKMITLANAIAAKNFSLQHLNIGGGLGVHYRDETPPTIADYAAALTARLKKFPGKIFFEPGRMIVADAGVLLTQVDYIKKTPQKQFAIVDAAMNDLIRPALYDAWHLIAPVTQRDDVSAQQYDVVGAVCESADFLGKNRMLAIREGDLLAIQTAGAYGFSMSSNYNSRPRTAEVLVKNKQARLIRARENYDELFEREIEFIR